MRMKNELKKGLKEKMADKEKEYKNSFYAVLCIVDTFVPHFHSQYAFRTKEFLLTLIGKRKKQEQEDKKS